MTTTAPATQYVMRAIVFTDVEDFGGRMSADEVATLQLVERDFALMKRSCAKWGGRCLKELGDGLLLDFRTPVDAVQCALDIQRTLAETAGGLPADKVLWHRIGIHLGQIFLSENDVRGEDVNIAKDIEGISVPGGICISRTVYDYVKRRVKLKVTRLGPTELKHVPEAIELYQIIVGLPPSDTPTETTADLLRPSEHPSVLARLHLIGYKQFAITAMVSGAIAIVLAVVLPSVWWSPRGGRTGQVGLDGSELPVGPSRNSRGDVAPARVSSSEPLLVAAAGSRVHHEAFWGPSGQVKEQSDSPSQFPYAERFDVRDPPDGSGADNQTSYTLTSREFHIQVHHRRSGRFRTLAISQAEIAFIPQAPLRFDLTGRYGPGNGNARLLLSLAISENGRTTQIFKREGADLSVSGTLEPGKRYLFGCRCDLETPAGANADATAEGNITLRFAMTSPMQAAGG